MPKIAEKQNVTAASAETAVDPIPVGLALLESKNVALKLLGVPVRGVEMLGAAVIKWIEGPPRSETAWMHETDFGSDKIRQECIDGYWEEQEAKRRAGSSTVDAKS